MAGDSLSEEWQPAFNATPRHKFLPEVVWRIDRSAGGRLLPLRRDIDPAAWLELASSDAPVNTQVDDGHPAPDGGVEVSSSASQPSVVATMLAALDVEPGMRVLEIGTGTGWNAALLAHRVGAPNVTTVEIDPEVAGQARSALARAGYDKVTVVTGDGELGHPGAAPYDRVIVTVGVREVPYPWIAQTVAGGLVLVPLRNAFHPPGLASLRVHEDGTATGRLGAPLLFIGLRSQRVSRGDPSSLAGTPDVTGETDLHPGRWANRRDAALAVGQRIGDGVRTQWQRRKSARRQGTMWLLEPEGRSWASVRVGEKPPYRVRQAGPRRLYDDVRDAYRWWVDQG
ncbi:methyltransferase domain-containing protein, partial [Pseudonocardia acaciae]|uniref:methyltransferase domain-containing protein n=1 Tax=Pseudonocardia acaciae TaxID=551276 RepID=UPI0012EDC6F0